MRWSVAIGVVLLGSVIAVPVFAAEEEELPPIRDFDIATIESLAAAMYAQDQLAWKATDIVRADRGDDQIRREGMRGWITVEDETMGTVRFIREGDGGPEVLYDVVFLDDDTDPALYTPASLTLTPEERAQYAARMLALDNIEMRCSENYNTVALKEPGSDNWLVWAMASSAEVGVVVLGGHTRFTISADGTEIIQADRLSRGCLNLEPAGDDALFRTANHVVSLTPVETHLFANLYHPDFRYVGTNDGTAWKMEGGRLFTVTDDAPGDDGVAARFVAGLGEQCTYIVTNPAESPPQYYLAGQGQVKIILELQNGEAFTAPEFEEGMVLDSVACVRRDIVPSPNDYRILQAGYSLYITDAGTGHPERRGNLELVDGEVIFEIEGELSAELQQRIQARIRQFEESLSAAP